MLVTLRCRCYESEHYRLITRASYYSLSPRIDVTSVSSFCSLWIIPITNLRVQCNGIARAERVYTFEKLFLKKEKETSDKIDIEDLVCVCARAA